MSNNNLKELRINASAVGHDIDCAWTVKDNVTNLKKPKLLPKK
jgi:hypothetical protein